MAFYYLRNKVPTSNISLRELYRLKGVNLNEDKTNNFRLSPYGSNTEGSHLGPGVNPWLSAFYGYTGNSNRGGMIEFNDPDGYATDPDSRMSNIAGADYRYSPYNYGRDATGGPIARIDGTVDVAEVIDDLGLAPNWVHTPYISWYAFSKSGDNMATPSGNWISYHRRSTTTARLAVGRINIFTSNDGSIGELTVVNTSDVSGVSMGTIGLNNVGQGDGTPYNEAGQLGGSNYATFSYRNTSSVGQFRILTTNQNYSSTPTLSVGSAVTYNNQGGSMLFFHYPSSINMGKGVQWSMAHRGANWIKIYYTRITGTTVNAHNAYTVVNLSSTNTLQLAGGLVKLSDEAAVIIAPHRNGASSGLSRRLVAHTLYASGTGKIPTISSAFAASYDWGSTDVQTCASAAGSSDDGGEIFGLSVFARSGTSTVYFISWRWSMVSGTFTWESSSIISSRTGYQTNSYRAPHTVIHMGYNENGQPYNYYQVSIGGDAGEHVYNIRQDATRTGSGALTIVEDVGKVLGTEVRRSYSVPINYEKGMPWFVNKPIASNYSGRGAWISTIYFNNLNYAKISGNSYNLPGI